MPLAIATDFVNDTDDPIPHLEQIADAGFSHIHWCHEWNTDTVYSSQSITTFQKVLQKLNLNCLDLHGSSGKNHCWESEDKDARIKGVNLVKNRIDMTAQLGGDAVVLHAMHFSDSLQQSLDTLIPYAQKAHIKIAIENIWECATTQVLDTYHDSTIALCYDSGHGNLPQGMSLSKLLPYKNRLAAVHLHDNDGSGDQHKLPFNGSIDWKSLGAIIGQSSYNKPLNLEVIYERSSFATQADFLHEALLRGNRILSQ